MGQYHKHINPLESNMSEHVHHVDSARKPAEAITNMHMCMRHLGYKRVKDLGISHWHTGAKGKQLAICIMFGYRKALLGGAPNHILHRGYQLHFFIVTINCCKLCMAM